MIAFALLTYPEREDCIEELDDLEGTGELTLTDLDLALLSAMLQLQLGIGTGKMNEIEHQSQLVKLEGIYQVPNQLPVGMVMIDQNFVSGSEDDVRRNFPLEVAAEQCASSSWHIQYGRTQ